MSVEAIRKPRGTGHPKSPTSTSAACTLSYVAQNCTRSALVGVTAPHRYPARQVARPCVDLTVPRQTFFLNHANSGSTLRSRLGASPVRSTVSAPWSRALDTEGTGEKNGTKSLSCALTGSKAPGEIVTMIGEHRTSVPGTLQRL